jgi:hypothetical protein
MSEFSFDDREDQQEYNSDLEETSATGDADDSA